MESGGGGGGGGARVHGIVALGLMYRIFRDSVRVCMLILHVN